MIRRPPRPTRTNTLVPDTRVCRSVIHPDGRAETLLEVGGTYPNGIAVDGEGNVLWVESFTGRLRRLRPSGGLDELHTFAPGHKPDRMAIDIEGPVYIAPINSGGLHIVPPRGRRGGVRRPGWQGAHQLLNRENAVAAKGVYVRVDAGGG